MKRLAIWLFAESYLHFPTLFEDLVPACAPAACRLSSLCADSSRFAEQVAPPLEDLSKLARRLALGRTMQAWSVLAGTRLFQFDYEDGLPVAGAPFQPMRGLQATHRTRCVHILDTFTKWRVPFADVAQVSQSGEFWVLGRVQQVRCEELSRVRFDFVAELGPRGGVRLRERGRDDYPTMRPDLISALVGGPRSCAPGGTSDVSMGQGAVRTIVPMEAIRHMEQTAASGRPHFPTPEKDRNADVRFVLDFPLPLAFEARSYWCRDCQRQQAAKRSEDEMALDEWIGSAGLAEDCAAVERDEGHYWAVSDDDIRRAFPNAVVYKPAKQAPVWATAQFIMELCTLFYEALNARQVRRQVAAIYSANALAEQLRQHRGGTAPYCMSWVLAAIPKSRQIRPLLCKVFAAFVQSGSELAEVALGMGPGRARGLLP